MAPLEHTEDLAKFAFERYRGGLQRYLMRRLDHAQNAQDLAQEVYLRLLRVDEADLVRQPQAYMYRIASHVVYEFKLREEREKECLTIDSEALMALAERAPDPAQGDSWRRMNTERELERVLAELPAVDQAIILMQKRDGLSYAQVAQRLGLSIHTVKKYLFRALLHLRTAAWDL
jgi:RNA polymerase sigma-70 factor (ECF subfamily)